MMGDYTNHQDLFSIGAVGGNLAVNLNYDSGEAAAEHANDSTPVPFGYGWNSDITMSDSTETIDEVSDYVVTDGNGGQTIFSEPSGDSCPSTSTQNDYESIQKYTISASSEPFCAADRVDAQFGIVGYTTQMNVSGGKESYIFDGYGKLAAIGNDATSSSDDISIIYGVTPGTGNCPSGPSREVALARRLQAAQGIALVAGA